MSDKKLAIKLSTLEGIGNAVREKEQSTEPIPVNALADRIGALRIASGENKFNQLMTKTITEVTAEDLAGATSIESSAFYKCILLAKVTIPDSVTKIGSYAFSGCQGLLNITIPNDATDIGANAFENCKNATGAVIIPDTVTKIGSSAFRNCANITGVAVPGISVSSNMGSNMFQYCSNLKDVVLKEGLSRITSYMFSDCHNLTNIIIPNSVTKIENDAFDFCSRLTSVTIGSGVTSISTRVFHACRSLTEIIVDESNTAYKSIDGALLTKDGKTLLYYALGRENTDFNIPDGVETIKTYAFSYAPHLETVTIGNSVKTVSSEALRYCPALTTVRIGSGITSIGSNAFSPEGLTTGPTNIYIDKPEGSISGAPWGAKNATVHWNAPLPSEEV